MREWNPCPQLDGSRGRIPQAERGGFVATYWLGTGRPRDFLLAVRLVEGQGLARMQLTVQES